MSVDCRLAYNFLSWHASRTQNKEWLYEIYYGRCARLRAVLPVEVLDQKARVSSVDLLVPLHLCSNFNTTQRIGQEAESYFVLLHCAYEFFAPIFACLEVVDALRSLALGQLISENLDFHGSYPRLSNVFVTRANFLCLQYKDHQLGNT